MASDEEARKRSSESATATQASIGPAFTPSFDEKVTVRAINRSEVSTKGEKLEKRGAVSSLGDKTSGVGGGGLSEQFKKLAQERQERQRQSRRDQFRVKVIHADHMPHPSPSKTFQELRLPEHLTEAVLEMGFCQPSPFQEAALPCILADPPLNVVGQTLSGFGKTTAYILGMLNRVEVNDPPILQAVCVVPSPDLAVAILDTAVEPMTAHMGGVKVQLAVPGARHADYNNGAHVIMGMLDTIVDWLKGGIIEMDKVKVFIFDVDASDYMLSDSDFNANALLLKEMVPRQCQSLFFSAAFHADVMQLAAKMVPNPDKIIYERVTEFSVFNVVQQLWVDCKVYDGGKLAFLTDVYSLLTIGQSIVFVGTKDEADRVHSALVKVGHTCSLLHCDMENSERDTSIAAFQKGKSSVLISSTVHNTGVGADNISLVVNYDLPLQADGRPDFDCYEHRAAMTWRFGRTGTAINLISDHRSREALTAIEMNFFSGGKTMILNAPADPEALVDQIEL